MTDQNAKTENAANRTPAIAMMRARSLRFFSFSKECFSKVEVALFWDTYIKPLLKSIYVERGLASLLVSKPFQSHFLETLSRFYYVLFLLTCFYYYYETAETHEEGLAD